MGARTKKTMITKKINEIERMVSPLERAEIYTSRKLKYCQLLLI